MIIGQYITLCGYDHTRAKAGLQPFARLDLITKEMAEQRVVEQRMAFAGDYLGGIHVDHGLRGRLDGIGIGHGSIADSAGRVGPGVRRSLLNFDNGRLWSEPVRPEQQQQKGRDYADSCGLQEKGNGITYIHGVFACFGFARLLRIDEAMASFSDCGG